MATIPDGGSAFPTDVEQGGLLSRLPGMTLRDYFAAHAPAEPERWFRPTLRPKPTAPAIDLDLPSDLEIDRRNFLNNLATNWRRDPGWDLEESTAVGTDLDAIIEAHRGALLVYATAWREHWNALNDWDFEYARVRLSQWPYAWADAMLAERRK